MNQRTGVAMTLPDSLWCWRPSTRPYTADFSAFVATERLRLANEGSIRTNIGQFMDKLRAAEIKSGAPATAAAGGN